MSVEFSGQMGSFVKNGRLCVKAEVRATLTLQILVWKGNKLCVIGRLLGGDVK